MSLRLEIALRLEYRDFRAERMAAALAGSVNSPRCRSADVFTIEADLDPERAAESLLDSVANTVAVDATHFEQASYLIEIGYKPGVTDNAGRTAEEVLAATLGPAWPEAGRVYTSVLLAVLDPVDLDWLREAARGLANPLVQRISVTPLSDWSPELLAAPEVCLRPSGPMESFNLDRDPAELEALSQRSLWSLDRGEMKTIAAYFRRPEVAAKRHVHGLSLPTRCELEILAQTWSEHCKHKEFNARIFVRDLDAGREYVIDGLFPTYIRAATEEIRRFLEEKGRSWLVKVFDDNAGIVHFDQRQYFAFKVETHNSPSALDPYGGALTGLVGVHRDPAGTGRIGARILFNVDIFCLASPEYAGELLPGMLHPKAIFAGVRKGVEDGGNQSGVPTINGSLVFDPRFRGKPLIFCGAAGIMPAVAAGEGTRDKAIRPGHLILMAGGRVGKDGIHGATFSSMELDETSPLSAVQIGDPVTQKRTLDFLGECAREGWIRGITDNGAGGLSSSVGELARQAGGAEVWLERVPLKYPGLCPWEIFVSESQERMTVVIDSADLEKMTRLAHRRQVELATVGRFADNGLLLVKYGQQVHACLDLGFLHDGMPRKTLFAEISTAKGDDRMPGERDLGERLLRVLGRLNVCSREAVVRQYDHEVKGRTAIKPLCGPKMDGHGDAAVICPDFSQPFVGIAVANGICPRYGDFDAYRMAQGAVDEAVRQIIAVGGRLPGASGRAWDMWSLNDNFCVPDSVWHEEKNPNGHRKLGKLVSMARGLHDAVVAYHTPLTSGKDSMKNDFVRAGRKVSVPPTLLVTAAARIDDVRLCITSDFKAAGDLVYLIGETGDHMAASEYMALFGLPGNEVSPVDTAMAVRLYEAVAEMVQRRLLRSCHDCSDGGMVVALAESAMAGGLGASVSLEDLPPLERGRSDILLFSESHSRFVVSVRPEDQASFEACLAGLPSSRLGRVTDSGALRITGLSRAPIVDVSLDDLKAAWKAPLERVFA